MKRKRPTGKRKRAASKTSSAKSNVGTDSVPNGSTAPPAPPVSVEGWETVWDAVPPPEALQREAEEEPNYRNFSQYASVIGTLREKGFSYRDIADWFSERGIGVDHNAVYRVYTNSLSDHDAHLESQREDEEAQDEADRNR